MGLSVLSGTLLFGTAALMYASRPIMADSPQQTYNREIFGEYDQVYVSDEQSQSIEVLLTNTETGQLRCTTDSSLDGFVKARNHTIPANPI